MKRVRRGLPFGLGATGAVVAAGLVATAIVATLTGLGAERLFLRDQAARARDALDFHAVSLEGFLDKYRILPPLIARHPDVVAHFAAGTEKDRPAALRIAVTATAMTGADEVLFVDTDGTVLVASKPVAQEDLADAPYFRAAMEGRLGRFLYFDKATKRGSYVFAAPVRKDDAVIGVVVAKVSLEDVEQAWALSKDPVVATDLSGRIVLSNRGDWRGRSLFGARGRDLSGATADNAPVVKSAKSHDGEFSFVDLPDEVGGGVHHYLEETAFLPLYDWTLRVYSDTALARTQMVNLVLTVLLAGLIATAGAGYLVDRRDRLSRQMRHDRAVALRMERRVRDRTRDLTLANARLASEVQEREATEEELRRTQSELVQAAKLAALGQMSAALSHEFNQPLAAIRSYADNAALLIERDRKPEAAGNLSRIAALVDRLAGLSRHLKTFARKPETTTRPISVAPALSETLMLLGPRMRKAGVQVDVFHEAGEVVVDAGQVRLEQVLMNIVGNALDAVAARPDPMVRVDISKDAADGIIAVSDNGPGISEADLAHIFDPFFTTKDVGEGLGLGLSIAYKIIQDFRGTIVAENRPEGGSVFTIRVPLSEPVLSAAE